MNPIQENKNILEKHKALIASFEPVKELINGAWDARNLTHVKTFIQNRAIQSINVTPIYNQYTSSPHPSPDLVLVSKDKGKALLMVKWASHNAPFKDKVVGIIEGDTTTLVNVHNLKGVDKEGAFCALFGGSINTDSTRFPLSPLRYTVEDPVNTGKNLVYGLSSGMKIQLTGGKGVVISSAPDMKVRSNRKVTNKVNKLFKEYIENAKALANLMKQERPTGTKWNWDDAPMRKLAKTHLGSDIRLNYDSRLDVEGLVLNPQKFVTMQRFSLEFDDETGVITPTNNFGVVNKVLEAAKVDNFVPMAYLLLDAGRYNVEKRILNAIRMVEGGFRIGE